MAYKLPNHTQTPNELLDDHLPDMGFAELKVVLVICRKTFGWHKGVDRISLSQLEKLTGLSRPAVVNGIKEGIDRGVIQRDQVGNGFYYSLICSKEALPAPSKEALLMNKGWTSKEALPTKERTKKSKVIKKDGVRTSFLLKEFPDFIED